MIMGYKILKISILMCYFYSTQQLYLWDLCLCVAIVIQQKLYLWDLINKMFYLVSFCASTTQEIRLNWK